MSARAALKADPATVEAETAANEAAREARAEVIEKAANDKAPPAKESAKKLSGAQKSAAAEHTQVAKGDPWHRFIVDVWLTNFNSFEFGFYKKSRNKAKSRQFTSDMDIFAEVIENGERTGVLGYREDIWKKAAGMEKRLVVKLFSDSLTWQATMDMMLGKSIMETIGARGLPVTCYSINTNDDDFLIYVERSANKWPLLPENFSFFLIDGDGRPQFFRLKRDLVDLGGDYTLLDEQDRVVGHLDGRVFSIGGHWNCKVRKDHGQAKKLNTVMKLFCALIIFNRGARRHVKQLWRDIRAGRLAPKFERQEIDLYMNPRRVR